MATPLSLGALNISNVKFKKRKKERYVQWRGEGGGSGTIDI